MYRNTVIIVCLVSLCSIVMASDSSFSNSTDSYSVSRLTQQLLGLDQLIQQFQPTDGDVKKAPIPSDAPYDQNTAAALMWHSVAAYCSDTNSLQSWNCNACKSFGEFTVTAVMTTPDNQGYVGWFSQGLPSSPIPGGAVPANAPYVLVSFRGTVPSKLSDWIEG